MHLKYIDVQILFSSPVHHLFATQIGLSTVDMQRNARREQVDSFSIVIVRDSIVGYMYLVVVYWFMWLPARLAAENTSGNAFSSFVLLCSSCVQ